MHQAFTFLLDFDCNTLKYSVRHFCASKELNVAWAVGMDDKIF